MPAGKHQAPSTKLQSSKCQISKTSRDSGVLGGGGGGWIWLDWVGPGWTLLRQKRYGGQAGLDWLFRQEPWSQGWNGRQGALQGEAGNGEGFQGVFYPSGRQRCVI